MRVTTAFNRMLGLPGGWVRDVEFGERAVIVTVALRRKRPVCSGCGARGLKIKDHRIKRWRHLDLGGLRCVIECRLRRLYCAGCGDLPEAVEWARGGARYNARLRRSGRVAGAADEAELAGAPVDVRAVSECRPGCARALARRALSDATCARVTMRPDPGAAGTARYLSTFPSVWCSCARRRLGSPRRRRSARRVTQGRTLGCDDGLTRGRDRASLGPVLRLDDEWVHGRISSSNRSARSSSGTV